MNVSIRTRIKAATALFAVCTAVALGVAVADGGRPDASATSVVADNGWQAEPAEAKPLNGWQ
ncbi:hypothetical protein [Streptomyces sp. NPDC048603]|uniref:hypothetical protein n=1 Tax=Streptomyces sp. NPDC048603 TaxID=3365577 RepID=UPI003716F064